MKPSVAIEIAKPVKGDAMTITTPRGQLAIFTIFVVVGWA
jgi:hypothetical protein